MSKETNVHFSVPEKMYTKMAARVAFKHRNVYKKLFGIHRKTCLTCIVVKRASVSLRRVSALAHHS